LVITILTVAGESRVALTTPCLLGEEAGVVMSLTSLSLALLGQVPEGIWYRPYTVEAVSVFHLKLTVLPATISAAQYPLVGHTIMKRRKGGGCGKCKKYSRGSHYEEGGMIIFSGGELPLDFQIVQALEGEQLKFATSKGQMSRAPATQP